MTAKKKCTVIGFIVRSETWQTSLGNMVACLWAGLSAAASVVSGCFQVELIFEKQSIGLLGEATSAVYMTWGADVTN